MPATTFPGVLVHHGGGEAAVLDLGAQAVGWTPSGKNPVLWLSPLADFDSGTAVRGGVPVIFPWFGAGPDGTRKPSHGFARTTQWQRLAVAGKPTDGELTIRHRLDGTALGLGDFQAEVSCHFTTDSLRVALQVTNTGEQVFSYEEALHTYLAVSSVTQVQLSGLAGHRYLDKVAGSAAVEQLGDLRLDGEVDRVFDHDGSVTLSDPGWGRTLEITKEASASTVVWNPGPVKGPEMADVGQYWDGFVCVEAGNVGAAAVQLAPGQTHELAQTIQVS